MIYICRCVIYMSRKRQLNLKMYIYADDTKGGPAKI